MWRNPWPPARRHPKNHKYSYHRGVNHFSGNPENFLLKRLLKPENFLLTAPFLADFLLKFLLKIRKVKK